MKKSFFKEEPSFQRKKYLTFFVATKKITIFFPWTKGKKYLTFFVATKKNQNFFPWTKGKTFDIFRTNEKSQKNFPLTPGKNFLTQRKKSNIFNTAAQPEKAAFQ